jgi:hypothetical protein
MIEKHVHERVSHLAWSLQGSGMIPVANDPTPQAQNAIQFARQSHAESLHSGGETAAVVGFDEEVQVIRLNAEVHDA